MKKYTAVFALCLLALFSAATLHAQQGFTGPQGFASRQAGFSGPQGFMGPSTPVTVSQVVRIFPHKAPAILQGNIISSLGSDRYLFRDSSGEVVIKIKNNRWWGLSVGPSDHVEIGGELKRDRRSGQINYFDAKQIRLAL